jgi:Ca2+-binding EF-hand superfamily protein
MKRVLVLAAFLGFFALAGVAHAQDMGEEGDGKDTEQPKKEDEAKPDKAKRTDRPAKGADRRSYQELGRVLREKDTDRDTKLSKEEFGDDDLFTKLDKDEDGQVTLQEMLADKDAVIASLEKQAAEIVKEEFGILDRDDSGKLSKSELGDDFAALLETGDTDKDGELSLEEFTAARTATDKAKRGDDRPGADRDPMAELDKDDDGKISKEEAGPRLKEHFDRLDKDGDGFITKEELEAMRGAGKRGDRMRKRGEEKKPESDTPEGDAPKKPEKESDKKPEGEKKKEGDKEEEF